MNDDSFAFGCIAAVFLLIMGGFFIGITCCEHDKTSDEIYKEYQLQKEKETKEIEEKNKINSGDVSFGTALKNHNFQMYDHSVDYFDFTEKNGCRFTLYIYMYDKKAFAVAIHNYKDCKNDECPYKPIKNPVSNE